jgi:hypothetical protein
MTQTSNAVAQSSRAPQTKVVIYLKSGSMMLAFGLLMTGFAAAFAPWLWRPPVALQLTGPGLAEFVKFLPQVRGGQLQVERLFFLLPLMLVVVTLPLFAGSRQLYLPGWLRWTMRLSVLPLALATLSPVWTPAILLAAEFRLQTILAGLALGLALISPLVGGIPLRILGWLFVAAGLAALVLPYWQFSLVQAQIQEAYHEPVSLGWGWWLTALGIVVSMAGSTIATIMSTKTLP